jgi:uncharacterized protein YcaQ
VADRIDIATLRRFVVAHQGFGRKRNATIDDVDTTIQQLQAVQLDSVSAVERAHRLTISSRVGHFGRDVENQLIAEGRAFEYWAHEACLLSMRDYPMMRRRMLDLSERHWWGAERDPAHEQELLAMIREQGALPTRAFADKNASGTWWGWTPTKRTLEVLLGAGEITIARRDGFQRIYELTERVIPRTYRNAPIPSESAFVREYAARAVEARGALTTAGVIEHCRLRGRNRRAIVTQQLDALVGQGRLRRLSVDDGGLDVFVPADATFDASPTASVLLCPFENMLWDRPFAARVFGFEHIIEMYKPEPQRRYGYYVLPLLMRDRIAARVDIRRNRAEGVMDVRAVHREPGQKDSKAFQTALDRALNRLTATALRD